MSKCIKCKSENVETKYHLDFRACSRNVCGSFNKRDDEHLHKYCNTCGYDWTEDTADKSSYKV